MKRLLLSLFVLIGVSFAALPPLHQGVNEIQTILNSSELIESLSAGEMIQEIIRTRNGYVLITTQNYLRIDVMYQTRKVLGPVEYTLKFYEPVALEIKEG